MKADRFKKVGIQRELHLSWFDQALRLHATGFDKRTARQELYKYLDHAPEFSAPPTEQAKTYIANPLIKTWVSPDKDLESLRDDLFEAVQKDPTLRLPAHWVLLGSAYPFWFEVAAIVGRLLNLQGQVTHSQIVARLKEQFGDRQTVSRRARYIIRSMVSWDVLKDSEVKGCYEKSKTQLIESATMVALMLEAGLRAKPTAKATLRDLMAYPGFFPFLLRSLTGSAVTQECPRIELLRYGWEDEVLQAI